MHCLANLGGGLNPVEALACIPQAVVVTAVQQVLVKASFIRQVQRLLTLMLTNWYVTKVFIARRERERETAKELDRYKNIKMA